MPRVIASLLVLALVLLAPAPARGAESLGCCPVKAAVSCCCGTNGCCAPAPETPRHEPEKRDASSETVRVAPAPVAIARTSPAPRRIFSNEVAGFATSPSSLRLHARLSERLL